MPVPRQWKWTISWSGRFLNGFQISRAKAQRRPVADRTCRVWIGKKGKLGFRRNSRPDVWAQYYEKLETIEDFTLCLLNDQSFSHGSAGVSYCGQRFLWPQWIATVASESPGAGVKGRSIGGNQLANIPRSPL